MTHPELPVSGTTSLMAGLRVLVVGLGRFGGGVGVTRWLVEQGAKVTVTDNSTAKSLSESIDALYGLGVTFRLGEHDPGDLDDAELVVINPAVVKSRSELFGEVQRRGMDWTTELNLFCGRCCGRVIGVTGTYGKSTICAMLAHVLHTCLGRESANYTGVYLGGNFGGSLLSRLADILPTDIVVLELSNAQLEDIPRIGWVPELAVICNLAPHHLDRYGGYAGYLDAKLNLLGDIKRPKRLIIGAIDAEAESTLLNKLDGSNLGVTRVAPMDRPIALRVPGAHNQANAACVRSIGAYLGLADGEVVEALAMFGGLPHRLEHVRTVDGVDYFNDSKATSPAATIQAVEALARRMVAIVGGQEKNAPFEACAEVLNRYCEVIICVGASGPRFAQALETAGGVSIRSASNVAQAVRIAHGVAQKGDAVLFSPGAPSFDAFDNFAHRGTVFVEAVARLAKGSEHVET
jgi:UDP-N-acetylmuramoylalanine--D-glutamate ligase